MKELLDLYKDWLKDGFVITEITPVWHSISTLFTTFKNEPLRLYAELKGEQITIIDGQNIINEYLEFITSAKEKVSETKKINQLLDRLGVCKDHNNVMLIKTNSNDFAKDLHNIIRAILAVDNMFKIKIWTE